MNDWKQGFLSVLFKKKSNPDKRNTVKTATQNTTEFDALMTGQLIAYYKKTMTKSS